MKPASLYGLMAEFDDPNALVAATQRAYSEGYRRMDAYSPFPIEELHDALGGTHTRLPLVVLIGGIFGGVGGYLLEYWVAAIAYPLNVGGRPYHSWPAFIPVTFECTILLAAFAAVFGMLGLNKLPRHHHPIFNSERFAAFSNDKFFVSVESTDPKWSVDKTRKLATCICDRPLG